MQSMKHCGNVAHCYSTRTQYSFPRGTRMHQLGWPFRRTYPNLFAYRQSSHSRNTIDTKTHVFPMSIRQQVFPTISQTPHCQVSPTSCRNPTSLSDEPPRTNHLCHHLFNFQIYSVTHLCSEPMDFTYFSIQRKDMFQEGKRVGLMIDG